MHTIFKEFFRKNKLAIFVGILVGLIILLPQIELIFSLGDGYHGIPINEIDNDEFYNSRARDVYDGQFLVKSPRVYWPEANIAMIPAFGEAVVAGLAKLTGFSIGTVPLVNNFLFPFLIYLFLYLLFEKITDSKVVSILSAAGVILISNVVFFPREAILNFTDFTLLTPSVYNRPVIPQVSSFVFFVFLFCFYRFLATEKNVYQILSGIIFGLLFYTYLYAWTFAVVFIGLVFLLLLYKKQYGLAKKCIVIGLVGLAVSIFFWINYFRASALPVYGDMQKRFGFVTDRTPMLSMLLFLDTIFLAGIYYYGKISWKRNISFVLLFVLTSFIVINQHVITGYRFFPGHWHWYFVAPISIFIFIWFAWFVTEKLGGRYFSKIFLVGVTAFISINGILGQHAYYLEHKEEYADFQRFGDVYAWINQNVSDDSVFLVNRDKYNVDLHEKLTVFTPVYSYLPDIADREYLISQDYFRHAYFVSLYLDGDRNPETDIQSDDFRLMTVLFGFYNRYQNKCLACYTDEEMVGLKRDYREFLKRDFEESLKMYKVDYALWDTKRDKVWNLENYDFLREIAEINQIKIYLIE